MVLVVAVTGCATTVHRLGRETQLPAGPARTACEKEDWLVLGESRAQVIEEGERTPRNVHGLSAFRVGSADPVDITELDPGQPIVVRKKDEVSSFHVRRYVAMGLGLLGAGSMAIGTGVFVDGFQTDAAGVQQVNGDVVAAGAITVGIGFALGIAGLIVNPSHADRTRANASHYFFDPSQDSRPDVDRLISEHDEWVRQRCSTHP